MVLDGGGLPSSTTRDSSFPLLTLKKNPHAFPLLKLSQLKIIQQSFKRKGVSNYYKLERVNGRKVSEIEEATLSLFGCHRNPQVFHLRTDDVGS